MLGDNNFNITIDNKYPPSSLREKVVNTLKEPLNGLAVRPEMVNIIPLDNVSAKITAFGETFEAYQVAKDLSTIVFKIPYDKVPSQLASELSKLDPIKAAKVSTQAEKDFLTILDTVTVTYNYWVQEVAENSCKLAASIEEISNVFSDTDGCPQAGADPNTVAAELETLTALNPEWAAVPQLISQVQRPISACLLMKEKSRLDNYASVSCTRSTDQNGNTKVDKLLDGFLKDSVKPVLSGYIAPPSGDLKSWPSELISKAIGLFGSFDKFSSTIDQIGIDRNSDTSVTDNQETMNKMKDFFKKFADFSEVNKTLDSTTTDDQTTNSDSNTSENYNSIAIPGVNTTTIGSGSSSTNSDSDAKFREFVKEFEEEVKKITEDQTTTEREEALKTFLDTKNIKGDAREINGKFVIIPNLSISIKGESDKLSNLASDITSNEIGDIVPESEDITVSLKEVNDLYLYMVVQCDQPFRLSRRLSATRWFDDPLFWKNLSNGIPSTYFNGTNCVEPTVALYYEGQEFYKEDRALLPTSKSLTIEAIYEDAAGNTKTRYSLLNLSNTNDVDSVAFAKITPGDATGVLKKLCILSPLHISEAEQSRCVQ